jgi:membrane-bound lytic murein transglycosylase B
MTTRRAASVVVAALGVAVGLVGLVGYAVLGLGRQAADSAYGTARSTPTVPAAAPATRVAPGPSRSGERPLVDAGWVARTSAAAGIPAPALRAYADAELVLRRERPSCHLSWNTVAGIGWVESQHGTVGGRTLGADGRSSQPILGPALDGSAGFAAIHSTPASQAWHGDAVWDHAVGPLQFLSSTWARWAADGDGDGVADPGDLDDAALAAGRYLCADGHDLATDGGWNAAVHSYNHDAGYVASVAAAANTYVARTR